jgi:formylglycine-generating enzyme
MLAFGLLGCSSAGPVLRVAGPTFDPPRLFAEPEDGPVAGFSDPFIPTLLSRSARCPAEMALVANRVCVDRWEASLVERTSDGGERAWSPYQAVDGHESRVRAVSRGGVVPQGYVSGRQAALACSASGKRLCRATEWEVACRGPEDTQFPYGNARRAGVCNDDVRARHPVPEAARILGIPPDALWRDGMNASLVNQLPETLLPTGARAACTNGWGVFDMVGNLHEWIDDDADQRNAHGTFRGGYYMDTSKNGEGCSYATTAHAFSYHDYSTGFRCCMDPEGVE